MNSCLTKLKYFALNSIIKYGCFLMRKDFSEGQKQLIAEK